MQNQADVSTDARDDEIVEDEEPKLQIKEGGSQSEKRKLDSTITISDDSNLSTPEEKAGSE